MTIVDKSTSSSTDDEETGAQSTSVEQQQQQPQEAEQQESLPSESHPSSCEVRGAPPTSLPASASQSVPQSDRTSTAPSLPPTSNEKVSAKDSQKPNILASRSTSLSPSKRTKSTMMNRRRSFGDRLSTKNLLEVRGEGEPASEGFHLGEISHRHLDQDAELSATIQPLNLSQSTNVASTSTTASLSMASPSPSSPASQSTFLQKLIIGIFLVSFVAFVIVDSLTTKYIASGLETFLEWIERNPIEGFFAFIVIYSTSIVLFIPGTIPTMGAGYVFAQAFGPVQGIAVGSLAVFAGACIGGSGSFFVGRFLLREWVTNTIVRRYAIFEALDIALAEQGFKIMTLLRLSPIIPFNAMNYIAGVTAVQFWEYLRAFWAIIPGTIFYVFLGASAGSLTDSSMTSSNGAVTWTLVGLGVVFGICAVGFTSYYAKTQLNKVVRQREERSSMHFQLQQHGSDDDDDDDEDELEDGLHASPQDISEGNVASTTLAPPM